MTTKNNKANASKKLSIKLLILMIVSGCITGLILHTLVLGSPLFIPWACLCVVNILTFLISGFGLFANLYRWINES